MAKQIRLSDGVYNQLDQFRGKRETFSAAVNRLLIIRDGIDSLTMTIEGAKQFAEFRAKKLVEKRTVDGSGNSPEVPDVRTG